MRRKVKFLWEKFFWTWQNEGFSSAYQKSYRKIRNKWFCCASQFLPCPLREKCDKDYFFIGVMPDNNPVIKTLRVKDEKDYSIEVPFLFEPEVKTKKVAAFVHVFYPELTEEIISYLQNIPCAVDVFVSTTSFAKKEEISKVFAQYDKGNVCIRVFPNRGRDIGGKLIGFADVYEDYEIFVHLHSKKSLHSGGLADWRQYTYETLLGSPAIVSSILSLLEQEEVGMVFPQHYRDLRACINWGYDYELAKTLLQKMGISICSELSLEFPSGSMFWAKTKAIQPLLNLQLSFEDFPEENKQVDGTLAHAIERSFLYVVESQGLRWLKVSNKDVSVDKETILAYQKKEELYSLMRQVYRPLFNKYVLDCNKLNVIIPELKEYKCFPDDSANRGRLNLLVPTINPSQVFGGVATALKLFRTLQAQLQTQFDYRIIVVNAHLDNESLDKYQNEYILQKLGEQEALSTVKTVILEAVSPEKGYISIRKNDIFIATAWWTMTIGRELIRHQERFWSSSRKLVYLIQDYESNFSQWSSRWALAEETYANGEKTVAIINSEELTAFMCQKSSFAKTMYIPYTINETLKKKLQKSSKKKQILFYGRPSVQRNAFELIVDGLAAWQKKHPVEAKEWKIISVGEMYPPEYVNNVKNIENSGKLSLEEYAAVLNESALGVSLMVSPHPSYPPLEMAYFGLWTITNRYDCKNLAARSGNFITLEQYSAEELAACLQKGVDLFAQKQEAERGIIRDIPCSVEKYSAETLALCIKNMVE